jgi:hypothetical protein
MLLLQSIQLLTLEHAYHLITHLTSVSECETVVIFCPLAIICLNLILKPHCIKRFCLYKQEQWLCCDVLVSVGVNV